MLDENDIKILRKYLDDIDELSVSEDTHALEDFAMEYGGFNMNTETDFIDVIEKIIGDDEEPEDEEIN